MYREMKLYIRILFRNYYERFYNRGIILPSLYNFKDKIINFVFIFVSNKQLKWNVLMYNVTQVNISYKTKMEYVK